MFKKLRNRFLLLHMGVVLLLVTTFFGSVLLISYNFMEQGADNRLNMLLHTRLNIQIQIPQDSLVISNPNSLEVGYYHILDDNSGSPNIYNPNTRVVFSFRSHENMPSPGMARRRISAEAAIFLTIDDEGQVQSVSSAYEMDEPFYADIAHKVLTAKTDSGKLKVYTGENNATLKYKSVGHEIVFLDISSEQDTFNRILLLILLVALPLLGVIFLVSLFFARSSIRPIEISYNRQKEFIADASHELKTPLATISANLEVVAGSADPEQKKWVAHIKSELKRMSSLTNSLLSLAKMDYEPGAVDIPLDMSALVSACLLPLEAALFEKGINLKAKVDPNILVRGNREQLCQLIGILLDNAMRYSSTRIEVTLKKTSGVYLSIKNDGSGISPEAVNKIWERFYRVDSSRVYDGGFGLGLPIAKAIVQRHGGKIHVESAMGGDTVFTVKLP